MEPRRAISLGVTQCWSQLSTKPPGHTDGETQGETAASINAVTLWLPQHTLLKGPLQGHTEGFLGNLQKELPK